MKPLISFLICFLLLGFSGWGQLQRAPFYNQLTDTTQWGTLERSQFTLYYKKNSCSDEKAGAYAVNILLGLNLAEKFLKSKPNGPFNLILLDGPESMDSLIGKKVTGYTLTRYNTILETLQVTNTAHEKAHLISQQKWGDAPLWLQEGTAVASDGTWWNIPVHYWAAHYLSNGSIQDLKKVIGRNGVFTKLDNRISYPLVGSIIQFIKTRYGADALSRLWRMKRINKALGIPEQQVLSEWRNYLEQLDVSGINFNGPSK